MPFEHCRPLQVSSKGLDLTVAYVQGDDVLDRAYEILGTSSQDEKLPHLDKENANIQLAKDTKAFLDDQGGMPIVSANAYLGIRAIRKGLEEGADIIICGRVADASPVIGAAAWWHNWAETDYDALAGALIAGHLIECSTCKSSVQRLPERARASNVQGSSVTKLASCSILDYRSQRSKSMVNAL